MTIPGDPSPSMDNGNGKTADSSISMIPLRFKDFPARNAFKYLG